MSRLLIVCVAMAVLLGADVARGQKGPEPLPADVVKGWKQAGARVGWMGVNRQHGDLEFRKRRGDLDTARGIPAFEFGAWREGMLEKLPAPGRPFGLSLVATEVTDTGLKELARLKNLSLLSLCTFRDFLKVRQ